MSRVALSVGLALPAFFLALHLLGLRDDVSILSGTMPGGVFGVVGGVIYALASFATVLVAPVLLSSALLHRLIPGKPTPGGGRALVTRRSASPRAGSAPALGWPRPPRERRG